MTMIRKQFYITAELDEKLKRLAATRGQTEAEVVRDALGRMQEIVYQREENALAEVREAATLERYTAEQEDSKTGHRSGLDRRLGDEAWRRELAFMKSLASRQTESTGGKAWKFNREEVYEERLDKILRRH